MYNTQLILHGIVLTAHTDNILTAIASPTPNREKISGQKPQKKDMIVTMMAIISAPEP